jgi:uncharacterized protein (DUF1778 family)
MKSYKEMADEIDELKDSGRELEGLRPIRARVAKNPRAVLSFRVTPGELQSITLAAKARGMNVSDFVRAATLAATQDENAVTQGERAALVAEVKSKLSELAETASRL